MFDRPDCCVFVLCLGRSLVALGACTFTLVSQFGFVGKADQARVAASVASGVGFIGAGVSKNRVTARDSAAGGTSILSCFDQHNVGCSRLNRKPFEETTLAGAHTFAYKTRTKKLGL